MRRPIGSASADSACSSPVGMPRSSSARWVARREPQAPVPSGRAGQAQVGVPSEGDRHGPLPGRDDRRVDRQLALAGRDGHLDAVRERERRGVDVDRRAEAGAAGAGRCVDRDATPAGPRAVRGSGARCRRCRAAARRDRRRRRQPGSGGSPDGWPTGRAAGCRAWLPPAAPPGRRAARGARGRGSAARPRSSRDRAGTSPRGRRRRRAPPADPGSGPRPPTRERSSRRRRLRVRPVEDPRRPRPSDRAGVERRPTQAVETRRDRRADRSLDRCRAAHSRPPSVISLQRRPEPSVPTRGAVTHCAQHRRVTSSPTRDEVPLAGQRAQAPADSRSCRRSGDQHAGEPSAAKMFTDAERHTGSWTSPISPPA